MNVILLNRETLLKLQTEANKELDRSERGSKRESFYLGKTALLDELLSNEGVDIE